MSEVKKFLSILYGTVIRFYSPVIPVKELIAMKEDIIEILTSLVVKGDLYRVLIKLCRLGTRLEEKFLSQSVPNSQLILAPSFNEL